MTVGESSGRPSAGVDPAALDDILAVLQNEREALRKNGGVEIIGVVGSLARGDALPGSDVDIVFEPALGFDYWKLGGIISEFRERFGRPVDMVDWQMMKPERWAWMSRDLIRLA